MAYDNPIPGFGTRNTINLRLWAAKPAREFDLEAFNTGTRPLTCALDDPGVSSPPSAVWVICNIARRLVLLMPKPDPCREARLMPSNAIL